MLGELCARVRSASVDCFFHPLNTPPDLLPVGVMLQLAQKLNTDLVAPIMPAGALAETGFNSFASPGLAEFAGADGQTDLRQ